MSGDSSFHVVVAGLWHLGSVTAACCARHFRVTGLDSNPTTIAELSQGQPPLFEPGLADMVQQGIQSGQLAFSSAPETICPTASLLWLTYDTPVNEQDQSDVRLVLDNIRGCLPHLPDATPVIVSSQLPVGTCRLLEREFPKLHIVCIPENLRLGRAIESFEKPERVVVGLREPSIKPLLARLLRPFCQELIWMRTESAEMVKHALNAFLALSVSFINEIARLCEQNGADASEVATGLKSDARIGSKAYLSPGAAFAGGTLARDVVSLSALGKEARLHLIPAIKISNDEHRHWPLRRLERALQPLAGRLVAVLGLTYKPGTSTLRRSTAVELCLDLLQRKVRVRAFDPVVRELPAALAEVELAPTVPIALQDAEAAVICTEWPGLRQEPWARMLGTMRNRLVLDPNRFLEKELKNIPGLAHLSVGHAT